MARKSNKVKANENHQLWKRANTAQRDKWQYVAQQGYDFYLNEQLSTEMLLKFIQTLLSIVGITLMENLYIAMLY